MFKTDNFLVLLFLVFLVLKLTGFITWSWWWVSAPIWGSMIFLLVSLLIMGSQDD